MTPAPPPQDPVDHVRRTDAVPSADDLASGERPIAPSGEPGALTAEDVAPAEVITPRAVTTAVATVALSLLLAAGATVPLPYAITGPGPTVDTLGEVDDSPLIDIQGADVYPTTGQLRLTTVSTSGGPGFPVTLGDVLRAWASGARSVVPVEAVFAPQDTRDEIDDLNQAEMVSSQENATVAALEELGYDVPTTLTVADAVEGTGADGVVRAEDVITSLDGEPMRSFSVLSAAMDQVSPGQTIRLGVTRGGEPYELDVVTTDDGDGRALIGVLIDPTFDLPVDVTIQIEDIGGPSAGTMFALGIIDRLTPEDEAAGQVIAGTGTMDLTGRVGPIGGIRQKLVGAARDGAAWFLAPAGNCDEVVGHVPDGLTVVEISTLDEARAAVAAIGAGDGAELPGCS